MSRHFALLLLGLVTLLPAAGLAATVVDISHWYGQIGPSSHPSDAATVSAQVADALDPTILGLLVGLPLVVFYVWHALARSRLESVFARLVWVVLLIFAAPLSMPIYWYAHAWAPLPPSAPRFAH
jgi:biopolymer transport protein ExbB/TolQ